MDTKKDIDTAETKVTRRDFLYLTTGSFTVVGAGALVWPFIAQMNPDASVKALASTEVDLSPIMPGQSITILWRGKPVFVRRRTEEEIAEAQAVEQTDLPDPVVPAINKWGIEVKSPITGTPDMLFPIAIGNLISFLSNLS